MKDKTMLSFLKVTFHRLSLSALVFLLIFLSTGSRATNTHSKPKQSLYLTCPVLKDRVRDFLRYHYVFHSFDAELSKRTFNTYFKLLDPGKLYFLKSDIDSFAENETTLGQKISNVDCRFIDDVYALYKKRVNDAGQIADEVLKKKFDFTTNEFIETDRKKTTWAESEEELKERWRKTIKFISLNMKESEETTKQGGHKKLVERLKKRYKMTQKDVNNRTSEEVLALFLNAFALSQDPHSSFLTPTDNAQFQIDFSLKLVGIGATLMGIDGYTTIDAIVPGGAAAKDGRLKKGDKIVAVDSGDGNGTQDIIDMDLDKVVQLIRGKEGTLVKLVIMRKEAGGEVKRFNIQLTRAVVQIKDSEAKSDVMQVGNKKIGIINLPSFYIDYKDCQYAPLACRSSANDMAREVNKLIGEKVDGIVVDLRRNGGGDLLEVQKIVGLFISNPVVVQVEDKEQQVRGLDMHSKVIYTGPMAVLVSKYTASASEILAGAFQDYNRGIVLGDTRTFGKGTVQTIIEIPGTGNRSSNGAIHVTIAKFFLPSGKSNQEKGILSDIEIPNLLNTADVGEKEYDYALPYTTISPSRDFKPLPDQTDALIPKLKELSEARIKQSKEFKEVLDAIQKAKEEKNTTLVSLKDTIAKKKKKDRKKAKKDVDKDDDLPGYFSYKVINKKDLSLKEAAAILKDGIDLQAQTQALEAH